MNLKRIWTAVVGLPIIIAIMVFGNVYLIDILFAFIAWLSLHEYYKCFNGKLKPVKWIGYVACFLISIIHLIPKEYAVMTIGVLLPTSIVMLFTVSIITNMKYNITDLAITFMGICYIPLFLMYIPMLLGEENGKILVWYVIIWAWATDIFAYCIGKRIGKHKFSKISPNKSIEGCIGGTIGAIICTIIYTIIINIFFKLNINIFAITGISIILSLIGQIGDFAASSIKRHVGIKDFSNLLPGHGGMLDRIDRLIFIAPFAYLFLRLL